MNRIFVRISPVPPASAIVYHTCNALRKSVRLAVRTWSDRDRAPLLTKEGWQPLRLTGWFSHLSVFASLDHTSVKAKANYHGEHRDHGEKTAARGGKPTGSEDEEADHPRKTRNIRKYFAFFATFAVSPVPFPLLTVPEGDKEYSLG